MGALLALEHKTVHDATGIVRSHKVSYLRAGERRKGSVRNSVCEAVF